MYGYTCEACAHEFDKFVRSQSQAQCLRAIPNRLEAYCPECGNIARRNLKDINLCSLTGDFERLVAMIGSPTPDPAYDKRLSVNAGRNYGVVIPTDVNAVPQKEGNKVYIRDDVECSCKFCTPVSRVKLLKNSESDLALAEFLERGGASLSGVHVDRRNETEKTKHHRNTQAELQKHINEPMIQDSDGEDDYALPEGWKPHAE